MNRMRMRWSRERRRERAGGWRKERKGKRDCEDGELRVRGGSRAEREQESSSSREEKRREEGREKKKEREDGVLLRGFIEKRRQWSREGGEDTVPFPLCSFPTIVAAAVVTVAAQGPSCPLANVRQTRCSLPFLSFPFLPSPHFPPSPAPA